MTQADLITWFNFLAIATIWVCFSLVFFVRQTEFRTCQRVAYVGVSIGYGILTVLFVAGLRWQVSFPELLCNASWALFAIIAAAKNAEGFKRFKRMHAWF